MQILTESLKVMPTNLKGEFNDEGQLIYSTCILIPKEEKRIINSIQDTIEVVIAKNKGIWNKEIPRGKGEIKLIQDGDAEGKGDVFKGHYFMNLKSYKKPKINVLLGMENGVGKYRDAKTEEIYWGCYCRVLIDINLSLNMDIICCLKGLLKIGEGERLIRFEL